MGSGRIQQHNYTRTVTLGNNFPRELVPVTVPPALYPEKWHDFVYRLNLYKVTFTHKTDSSNINSVIVIGVNPQKALEHVGEWMNAHFGDDFPIPTDDDYTLTVDHLAEIGGYVQGVVSYSYIW